MGVKRIRKKVFYPVAFAAMLFASSAMAKINPTAFTDEILKVFLKDQSKNIDMTAYSTLWGEVGLESGIFEAWRFCGPFEAAFDKNGERDYKNDKHNTPLGKVIMFFWPSGAGQFSSESNAFTNFARYVKHPKTLALLANYVKKVEDLGTQTGKVTKATADFEKDILETLEGIPSDKKVAFINQTLKPLLQNIRLSLQDEKKKGSFYPPGITLQAIQTFFCYHFNKQEDILDYVKNLDDSIVDKDKKASLPTVPHYLKEEDVEKIAKKPTPTLNELFDLTQAYIFTSLTPYKAGISLLNNGTTYFYDRANDAYLKGKDETFQDCVEMTMRHLCNLLLFDPLKREFNLNPIKDFLAEQDKKAGQENKPKNPYLKNFEDFYDQQRFFMANAGDIGTRSLWNKVVADLPETTYVHFDKKNEMKSGFRNMLQTFDTVFNLSLKPAPTEFEEQKTWVEESFQTLFSALNPSYTYAINLDMKKMGDRLIGLAGITVVSKTNNQVLFSFNIEVKSNHTEVNQLKSYIKPSVDYTDYIQQHRHILKKGTAEESLLLLASPTLQKDLPPLYQLYSQPMSDSASKIDFLTKLHTHYNDWKRWPSLKETLPLMTTNVLNGLAWDDSEIVNEVLPIIHQFLIHPALEKNMEQSLRDSLKNLKAVGISSEEELERIRFLSKNMTNLEQLDASYSSIKKIASLENLTALKNLDLSNTQDLEKISVKGLTNLEGLLLRSSSIREIYDLAYLSKIKKLDLANTKNLRSLSLKGVSKIEELFLTGSGLKTIDGLENLLNLKTVTLDQIEGLEIVSFRNLPNLKTLDLGGTKNLETISLKEMPNLEGLWLVASAIKRIDGLDGLTNLKTLFLGSTKNLDSISLKGMSNLENLDLNGSFIQTIKDFEDLSKLKRLDLSETSNLKLISLKGGVNLESVNFNSSGIAEIRDLQGLSKLRSLDLTDSYIAELKGLGGLSNLKTLTLTGTKNLQILSLKGLSNLQDADLANSFITSLTDISKGLRSLSLRGCKNITELEFTEDNKALNLDLRGSGIKRGSIKGIEHLDESKIRG